MKSKGKKFNNLPVGFAGGRQNQPTSPAESSDQISPLGFVFHRANGMRWTLTWKRQEKESPPSLGHLKQPEVGWRVGGPKGMFMATTQAFLVITPPPPPAENAIAAPNKGSDLGPQEGMVVRRSMHTATTPA
jgi:hypothetical protein